MSDLVSMTEDDLENFFGNSLVDLVEDEDLRRYVTRLMVEFASMKRLPVFFDVPPESIRLEHFLGQVPDKAYDSFRVLGDSCLWICGFYTEQLVNQSRSGLGVYINMGQTSYKYAVSAGEMVGDPNAGIILNVSRNFKGLTGSIFDFRKSVNMTDYFAHLSSKVITKIVDALEPIDTMPLYLT